MQQIGELFLLRININLVGSVLDYPVSSDTSSESHDVINPAVYEQEVFWVCHSPESLV